MLTHQSFALDTLSEGTRRVAGASVPFGDTSSVEQCTLSRFVKGCPTAYRFACPLTLLPLIFEDKNVQFEDSSLYHEKGVLE